MGAMKEGRKSETLRIRNQFDVITTELLTHPMVMCHADSLEDLFDKLAPWHVEGRLGLYEKVTIVRAMRATQSGWGNGYDCDFTAPFQINEDFPSIIIQMS